MTDPTNPTNPTNPTRPTEGRPALAYDLQRDLQYDLERDRQDDLEQVRDGSELMAGLRFSTDADLPTDLPPVDVPPVADVDDEPMVVRSVRMPLGLDRRLKAAATARGVPVSQLLREWAELELATLEHDQPISRADALRALAAIRPLGAA